MEKTLNSEILYRGRAVNLRRDTVEKPDGSQTIREIVEHVDCVTIIPVDAENNVLLVRQYRKSVEKDLLELPAGGIEPGEKPAEAVIREMREETGFKPGYIEKIGGFYSTPGYTTEFLYLFTASSLESDPLTAEDTDEIKIIPTPLSQIPDLILSGEIQDAKSVAGLLTYLLIKK